jgi:hypothetical protein
MQPLITFLIYHKEVNSMKEIREIPVLRDLLLEVKKIILCAPDAYKRVDTRPTLFYLPDWPDDLQDQYRDATGRYLSAMPGAGQERAQVAALAIDRYLAGDF